MAYSREQRRNLRLAKRVGRRVGASRTEQAAAVAAELVESGARNLSYGDRDSVGILQQRPSQGWRNAANPEKALEDFYTHARQYRGQGLSVGDLAQAVQRSAFPERYGQRADEAKRFVNRGGGATSYGRGQAPVSDTQDPQARRQLLTAYLATRDRPDALLNLAAGLHQLDQTGKAQPAVQGETGSGSSRGYANRVASRAAAIDRQRLPYQWGGGHGSTRPGTPLDCSGAVSKALGIDPRVSGEFTTWGKPGEGGRVTVYANDRHVLMKVKVDGVWRYWGTSATNPSGGAGWIRARDVSPEYLAGFTARHM